MYKIPDGLRIVIDIVVELTFCFLVTFILIVASAFLMKTLEYI
jgi:hypothetical protein